MNTREKKAPIVAATTTGASVDMNPQDNGLGTAPFIAVTDTGYSVANAYDANCRGRAAVQGA